jgi:hypothetical protein
METWSRMGKRIEDPWTKRRPGASRARRTFGRHAGTLGKVARLLGLEFVEVGQWRLEGMP